MAIAPCPVTGKSLAPPHWHRLWDIRFINELPSPSSALSPAPGVSPHRRDAPDTSASLWALLHPLQQLLVIFSPWRPEQNRTHVALRELCGEVSTIPHLLTTTFPMQPRTVKLFLTFLTTSLPQDMLSSSTEPIWWSKVIFLPCVPPQQFKFYFRLFFQLSYTVNFSYRTYGHCKVYQHL